MSTEEVVTIIVSAVLGGSGITGIIFIFLRRYIEKALNNRDSAEEKRRENRIRRNAYNDELQHAQGRLLFWLYQAVTKGNHNGELEQAFSNFQTAEKKIKEHDRKIIAESESD